MRNRKNPKKSPGAMAIFIFLVGAFLCSVEWYSVLPCAFGFQAHRPLGVQRSREARHDNNYIGIQSYFDLQRHKRRQQHQQQPIIVATTSVHVMNTITADHSMLANDDENDEMIKQHLQTLGSYVNNLQIARSTGDLRPAQSLAYYLIEHPLKLSKVSSSEEGNIIYDSLSALSERTLTHALRTAGEKGDYRLVIRLIDASISYANNRPILTPRIFGEALNAIAATGANVSKLKYIWNLVSQESTPFLQSPLSAFELNIMLKSLSKHDKVRACIGIYRQHTKLANDLDNTTAATLIVPDAYTASILFEALAESIKADQKEEPATVFVGRASSLLEKSLKALTRSSCWQWNTAVELLAALDSNSQWNNHAYSALLKLHEKAQETFPRSHENGPPIAVAILDSMMSMRVVPDIMTCSSLIKAMGDPNADPESWKLAVAFFERMKSDPKLPDPNHYTYSAVIVACARCKEYHKALELIEEMRTAKGGDGTVSKDKFVPPAPNTWVYNAALLAIGSFERSEDKLRKSSKNILPENNHRRDVLAMQLLEQMKEDNIVRGLDTKPDTVTYNTIFAIIRTVWYKDDSSELVYRDKQVLELLNQMKNEGVAIESKTYENAILTAPSSSTILDIINLYLSDIATSKKYYKKGFLGKLAKEMTSVFNAALSVVGSRGDGAPFREICSVMIRNGVPFDNDTTLHMIEFWVRNGHSELVSEFFAALGEDKGKAAAAQQKVEEETGLEISWGKLPPLSTEQLSSAISICLRAGALEQAHAVFSLMRESGIKPTVSSLENFSISYARAALASIAEESKQQHMPMPQKSVAKARAQSAYKIAVTFKDPPLRVLMSSAKACAMTWQWQETRTLLHAIHKNYLDRPSCNSGDIEALIALQNTIFSQSTKEGNLTAALWFTDDIQRFAGKFRGIHGKANNNEKSELIHYTKDLKELWASFKDATMDIDDAPGHVGMRAENWVSLVQAASESGHWRLCVNTLQFLQPYLKRSHPESSHDPHSEKLVTQYGQLLPALTAAAHCLEQNSQYAWAGRIIKDWMDWSGRKPRPEAALAAIRALSANGQGEEVKCLLSQCIEAGASLDYSKKGINYDEMMYIGAVTALHNNGLYDDADEVMISGISRGALPFAMEHRDGRTELDLHGLNVALAHSSVRIAMRQQSAGSGESSPSDMLLITGRGRNSALQLRPVLRPEVQRMLLEEFYPPLNTISAPGNLGALIVFASDIAAWQAHQQEQKGARMLELAALLKNFSTKRLSRSISLSIGRRKETSE